jgi:hypothetical protein
LNETGRTVRVLIRKGYTITTGDSKCPYSRAERSVEFDVPVENLNTECRLWKAWIESELAEEVKGTTEAPQLPPAVHPALTAAAQEPVTVQSATPSSSVTDDPYATLPWHQSKNDANLSMIRVNEKLPPLAIELYHKLKAADQRTLRIGDCCYKLWVTGDGAEFLQKWARPRGGN